MCAAPPARAAATSTATLKYATCAQTVATMS
jgi:hypothetical protein